jgi:hypothetical protein
MDLVVTINVKSKAKFTLEQAMKAQRQAEVYLYSFFNLSARWRSVVNPTPREVYVIT